MAEDITPQVLQQIRQDMAGLGERMSGFEDRVDRNITSLREEMRRGFAHTQEQLSSMIALMGVLAKNDDRLERRIEAIEARLAQPG